MRPETSDDYARKALREIGAIDTSLPHAIVAIPCSAIDQHFFAIVLRIYRQKTVIRVFYCENYLAH